MQNNTKGNAKVYKAKKLLQIELVNLFNTAKVVILLDCAYNVSAAIAQCLERRVLSLTNGVGHFLSEVPSSNSHIIRAF